MASDHRVLPNRILNLYLYPIGAWGLGLLALYFTDRAPIALTLCFPLALWLGGLTLYWGGRTIRRVNLGEYSREEANAGVLSVGHILAAAAASPAIVFLAADPLARSTWSLCAGIAAIAAVGWLAVSGFARLKNRYGYMLALTLAWLALPINATGAASMGHMMGWFDAFVETIPGAPNTP